MKTKQALKAYVHEYEKVFRNLQEDAFDMLCVISNIEELLKLKNKLRTAKGGYNLTFTVVYGKIPTNPYK